MTAPGRLGRLCKRGFDLVLAVPGTIALLPLFAVIGVAIKLDSRGPVFFRQDRAGRNGRPYRVWKFRTMVEGAVHQGAGYLVIVDDPRITRVGRILRRFSLDELPQVTNVLLGEMSIVGPRPAFTHSAEQYSAFQRQRLLMPPGITGWAQVNGRNELSWPDRIRLDVWYIEHWSLALDLRILARTLKVVLSGQGTYTADLSKFEVRDKQDGPSA